MVLEEGIHVVQLTDALIETLDVVEQDLEGCHEGLGLLIGLIQGAEPVVRIVPALLQGGVDGIDVAVVLALPLNAQVFERLYDGDRVEGQ